MRRSGPVNFDRRRDTGQRMVDTGAERKGATQAIVARLRRSRWLLAAAVVAVFAVYGFGGLSIYVPLLALALLVAAAMLPADLERQSAGDVAAIEAGGLQRLSGAYLAAAVADPLIIFDQAATIVHANAAAFAAFGGLAPGMSLSLKFRAPEMQALLDGIVSGAVASDIVDYTEKLPVERTYPVSASSVGHATD